MVLICFIIFSTSPTSSFNIQSWSHANTHLHLMVTCVSIYTFSKLQWFLYGGCYSHTVHLKRKKFIFSLCHKHNGARVKDLHFKIDLLNHECLLVTCGNPWSNHHIRAFKIDFSSLKRFLWSTKELFRLAETFNQIYFCTKRVWQILAFWFDSMRRVLSWHLNK